MGVVSIRGAITVDNNTAEDISSAAVEMFREIIGRNNILMSDIVNIIFSVTKDLNAIYPAKALREHFDIADTPLFCVQEADIQNSLEKCIRVMVTVISNTIKSEVKHVYLKGAKNLRPDLSK